VSGTAFFAAGRVRQEGAAAVRLSLRRKRLSLTPEGGGKLVLVILSRLAVCEQVRIDEGPASPSL